MQELLGLLASVAGVLTVLATFLGSLQYFKTRREKMALVRQAFDAVVASLASKVEVERMAGAILLRRFYDQKTELGIGGTPYWKEAVNVTTAILREQGTGNFQKILADGLAFAPSLERADLQRTNLQFAYLGAQKRGGNAAEEKRTNLSFADFYRADLSGASLKRADARGAKFYQARLHDTVLTEADLRDASFFEADLKGAKLKDALLDGASFLGARSLPPTLRSRLDEEGVYRGSEKFKLPGPRSGAAEIRVFISQPGLLNELQQQFVAALLARLEAEGLKPEALRRRDYPCSGSVSEVRRLMTGCAGAVVFGFKQLEVREGVLRAGTAEEKQVADLSFSTPWCQVEVGMAAMLGLPIYVLCQRGVQGGIFDLEGDEHQFHRAVIEDGCNTDEFLSSFAKWCLDVRERARTPVG